jgi:DNA recombination protein RmuC
MNDAILWLILLGVALTAVLLAILLIRVWTGPRGEGSVVQGELRAAREESRSAAKDLREEVSGGLRSAGEALARTLEGAGLSQHAQLESIRKQLQDLAQSNQEALDRVRGALDQRVKELQESNDRKLDEMRRTVDEKLHETLERRLGESFKIVSDRLEAVHKGLGEMQNLATGVGDLKRVLTNVKARGTWAEVQLAAILEQILTPAQFERNVRVKADTAERVEYAVRLPGPSGEPAADFAIMFLATEGLYAEVLRQPGLVDDLQQRFRVVVAGPTTLAALLSSLRMGFQTLAIEQRAAEAMRLLGAIKLEFGKFGDVLDKVKRQLHTASQTIEATGARTRAIERHLRAVEELPEAEAAEVLVLPPAANAAEAVEAEVEGEGETAARE